MPGGQPEYWQGDRPEMGSYRQSGMYADGGYAPDEPTWQSDTPGHRTSRPSLSPGVPPYVAGGPPRQAVPVQVPGPQPITPPMQAQPRVQEALAVPLAVLGGLVGGVIGAAIWAYILDATRINFSYLAFVLGIIVGLGVAIGARGQHDIGLSLFAGALGVCCFGLALYFRLSLRESHSLSGLSPNDFSNLLGDYLTLNPINFLNFGLVPLAAMGTAYRYIHRGGRGGS